MKIQYISDIHLELLKDISIKDIVDKIIPNANICILGGDIGNPFINHYEEFLKNMNDKFNKIFIIAGNHEYYNNNIEETKIRIIDICKNYQNISFLDNNYEDYEGYRWIGTTQWTHINNPEYKINDIYSIKDFDIEKYNKLHNECKQFLIDSLKECKDNNIKTIIITHHLPIYNLTAQKYKYMCDYSQWFNADLNDIIKQNNKIISGWFYGHTHESSVQKYYNVNFYCNPIGYNNENINSNYNIICDIY
jgi:predicted MPP superfamily phosphohydrolase